MPIAEPTATYGNLWQKRNGYVTAVSVALGGGARTVSINKIWKNLGTFLLATVSLSPGLTVLLATAYNPSAQGSDSPLGRVGEGHSRHG